MTLVIDTNVFIYLLDKDSPFNKAAVMLFQAAESGELELVASELVLTEVLSQTMSDKVADQVLADVLKQAVEFKPIVREQLLLAARMRRECHITLADAIHLALAAQIDATFVTNDKRLSRSIPGVRTAPLI
jgi:predicted nucleic acid-binding protein